jgi:hypothetical protein
MNPNNFYIRLKDFVTPEEKSHLLSLAESGEFYVHRSTVSNKISPLNFLSVNFRNFERAWVMKMYPNTKQEMHTDGITLDRNVLIIQPLTDNYAPLITQAGEINFTAVVNTQELHAVYNNNYTRINLQIPFSYTFNEIQDKKHEFWNIVEGLYDYK